MHAVVTVFVVSLLWAVGATTAFVVVNDVAPRGRNVPRLRAVTPSPAASELKRSLLERVTALRGLRVRDENAALVDGFGVRGGELNATSRAPQKVDYYAISDEVGRAADDVVRVCDDLAGVTPLDEPTASLGNGTDAPLHGTWRLLFTTAADASFSKNSTRGAATVRNVVDGPTGRVRNVVDFAPRDDGTEPALKQLNVIIQATAVSKTRVELRFKYAKAVLTRFFFVPLFGRRLNLYIPVPGPFITRILVFLSRLVKFGKKKGGKSVPKAFFDVLYLDDDLRVHRTGEDNLFVQARDTWHDAQPLLD